MALKGFGEREYGFEGLPKSRYEEAIKARKAAAEQMVAEAEKRGKGAATMAAKWVPRIAGTAIGAFGGQPMAGYQAGAAVGDIAAGVVQEDEAAVMRGLEQAPQAIAGGMKVAEGLEGAAPIGPTGKPSLGDYASQLEIDPDLRGGIHGTDILQGMTPQMQEFYASLSPEMKQEFLFNQLQSQQLSLSGFGTK